MSCAKKLWRWGLALSLLLLGAITTIAFVVRQIASRIDVDPQALTAAASYGVNETLAKGRADQKLHMIAILEEMGADAKPFVPALIAVSHEGDATVSVAAQRALSRIDPKSGAEIQN